MARGGKWWWWAGAAAFLWWLYPRRILGYNFAPPVDGGVGKSGWGDYRAEYRTHVGMDVYAPRGVPVKSSLEGDVVYIDSLGATIEGKVVGVRSGELVIRYLHLDTIAVQLGQHVTRGEVIGTLGGTGNASVPHVHIDISALDSFLERFKAEFGAPTDGYWRTTGYGTVVPAETLIPVASHTPEMLSKSASFGVTVRS